MVRAVDIEGLLQKYVEENSLERADALYLLYTVGSEEAAKTLRVRYGRSGALSSILDDLKGLGVNKADSYEKVEDTGEYLGSVIQDSFKRMCLDLVVKSAKARAAALSRNAREVLYLISLMRPESVDIRDLRKFYRLLFQRTLADHELERALDAKTIFKHKTSQGLRANRDLERCTLKLFVSYAQREAGQSALVEGLVSLRLKFD